MFWRLPAEGRVGIGADFISSRRVHSSEGRSFWRIACCDSALHTRTSTFFQLVETLAHTRKTGKVPIPGYVGVQRYCTAVGSLRAGLNGLLHAAGDHVFCWMGPVRRDSFLAHTFFQCGICVGQGFPSLHIISQRQKMDLED